MPKCPNCGQTTLRTEDWACQWCGYPLLSESYKKIEKTYKQLKEEKLPERKPLVREEIEVSLPLTRETLSPTPAPEPVAKPEPEAEPAVEAEPEPVAEAKPEPVAEAEPEAAVEAEPEPAAEARPEPVAEAEPEAVAEAEPEPAAEAEPEPVAEVKPEPVAEPEPEPPQEPEIEVTVEELLLAYKEDGVAADAKFVNKILKVTGVVDRIEAKDVFDTYYINLTGAEGDLLQNLRCVFNKKHKPELTQLTIGQTVTVQGKYDGSIMDIRMSNCVLVD